MDLAAWFQELRRRRVIRALVVATIRRFDQLYAIDLKVLDPATSEYFFTLKEERTGKAAIPAMLDRLSEKAREKLRETRAEVGAARVTVADATTQSHEAWRHYFEGQKWEDVGDLWFAIRSYEKAVAADPRFAMAHYRIAYLGEFVGYPRKLRDASMEAAYKEIDRVPAKERLLFQAWKAHVDGRASDAHALYARAAEAYPLDKEVLYLAGDPYLHEGNAVEALPWFEGALALDPAWSAALAHLIQDTLPALGRREEALARARRWAEHAPGAFSRSTLLGALAAAGRREEALEVARRAASAEPGWDRQGSLAKSLIMADRFEEAEAVLRPFVGKAAKADERLDAIPFLVTALAHQGRRREALRVIGTLRDVEGAQFQGKPALQRGMRWQLLMNERDHGPALREAGAIRADGLFADGLFTGYLYMGEDRLAAEIAAQGLSQPATFLVLVARLRRIRRPARRGGDRRFRRVRELSDPGMALAQLGAGPPPLQEGRGAGADGRSRRRPGHGRASPWLVDEGRPRPPSPRLDPGTVQEARLRRARDKPVPVIPPMF